MATTAEGAASWLLSKEPIAIGIFVVYFALIATFSYLVYLSVTEDAKLEDLFSGRPFLFIRLAVAALGCTWYFMIEYMKWSFRNYASAHRGATFGQWLLNTALFEEAWSIVCDGPAKWWISSWICIWSVFLTAVIYRESPRRNIKYPWAYLILGMLVAISVATSLYLAAIYLHPRKAGRRGAYDRFAKPSFYLCLPLSLYTIYRIPSVTGTPLFLPTLLLMHVFLLVPFISFRRSETPTADSEAKVSPESLANVKEHDQSIYITIYLAAFLFFITNTAALIPIIPASAKNGRWLFDQAFSHPAQGSISMDVLWTAVTVFLWYLVGGSFASSVGKSAILAGVSLGAVLKHYGINWGLLASAVPILSLLSFGVAYLALSRVRSKNAERRKELLESMGLKENVVVPGTKDTPPSRAGKKLIVGFWHPYCNAGGGGERVLWSALAYIQRTQPETVTLIYSGDYPAASKEMILAKAKDRFSIDINPKLVKFIPLPSRYLISDKYWSKLTLLGQSAGSVFLAWEGLCGKQGIWGDMFIDTMGHAFTYPFVRLFTGSEMVIAAYTHYPTVSADMVRRVRSREAGVESGGRKPGWIRTVFKLVYYSIFTRLYATSLLFAESIMTNSSWTQNHIETLLTSAKRSILAAVLLLDEKTEQKKAERGDKVSKRECKVVYPPCDAESLTKSRLEKRGRGMVSLAQFRPEKAHAKQLYALAELFKLQPSYRQGNDKVTLTLMGGVRDAGDQARLDELNILAEELGITDNVEFVVNAPYSEIVKRLSEASIGLNTMQDEHFGINVVEFMAAGLIPIVHASAGPYKDIVIARKGDKTGFHAKTAEQFAIAIQAALTMSPSEEKRMRDAARKSAMERFSQAEFEKGWEGVWVQLLTKVRDRITY